MIREGTVNWQPYDEFMEQMLVEVRNDCARWFANGPIFHFWIVEFQYHNRVMRQFGRRQIIPPPVPHSEDEL